jgi:hypothetical protein
MRRYGSRKSDTLVRCYLKDEIGVFRVEVELHGSLLRRQHIWTLEDFVRLPDVIHPKHLRFVDFDRARLKRYLARKRGAQGRHVVAGAAWQAASLRTLKRYFTRAGVVNVHRFLVPLSVDEEVRRALKRWARHFVEEREPSMRKNTGGGTNETVSK